MALPIPARPPEGAPAILLTVDPAAEPDGPRSPVAAVGDGRLAVQAPAPGAIAGYPFSAASFRDVVIDAVVALEAGGSSDAYGLFLRQVSDRAYLAFVVTPDRRASILAVEDGVPRVVVDGAIPDDAPFAPGLAAANRLTLVSAGPCLTCIVNGSVLTGVIVDPHFKAGLAGVLLVHGGQGADSRMGLRWAQVRAVLADQA